MSPPGPLTVGIDIGTTSVKGVAVDGGGNVVERVRIPHPLVIDAPDHLAHDADKAWRRGPRAAWRRFADLDPAAVAVATMVPSLAPVDAKGRPIGPGLLYGDARGGGTDDFLGWLSAEYPDAADHWPASAVANHALGGVPAVDIGTAFMTEGLADRMSCIANFGEAVGTAGTATLAAGGIDVLCEQLVAGVDEPGDVLVMCGTTLLVWAVTEAEVQVPGLWTVPHLSGGRWMVGGASNAGGLFLGWVRSLHGRGGTVDPANVPVWVPYVRGERTPLHDPTRRASLHGLDLTHGPAAVERAAFEAAGFVVRHHLDLAHLTPRRIVATGGGTRVPGWVQALADCTGCPVHVAAEPEGAAIGAAYLARTAVTGEGLDGAAAWARTGHVVEPDPVWVDRCDDRYGRFRELAA